MRAHTFKARSMPEAMRLVREHLGPDAIVLSTEPVEDGEMAVTAVADHQPGPAAAAGAPPSGETEQAEAAGAELAHDALLAHGTPDKLMEDLLRRAIDIGAANPLMALAAALAARFTFVPVSEDKWPKPLMLVGPPGAGKTITMAKIATRSVMSSQPIRVISSDTVRAGGIEQLEAITRLLGLELHRADDPKALEKAVVPRYSGERILVDSAGINPYSAADRRELSAYIAAAGAEPILVLPAGGDLHGTIEICKVFRTLGCQRMLVTRVDMVRRLGSILGGAVESGLAFCDVGTGPDIAHGLTTVDPVFLARLLMLETPKLAR